MDTKWLQLRNLHVMFSRIRFFLLVFMAIILMTGPSYAQSTPMSASEVSTFKKQVADQASRLQSLESDFIQLKHLDFVEQAIKSVGKLSFKSPQRIRWEYTSPFQYYVIFDDNRMFINDGGNTKDVNLASNALLRDMNNMLAGTVQGDAIFDDKRFDITYYRVNSQYQTVFVPKERALSKYIQQIEMTFDPSSYLVTNIKIVEPSMDYTEITFSNQKRNTPIADEKFLAR